VILLAMSEIPLSLIEYHPRKEYDYECY